MWDLSTFFEQNVYMIYVAWCFLGVVFVQVMWYLIVFLRVVLHKNKVVEISDELPPVSVVICARNEYQNLLQHLPVILSQNYPNFEVIVVNDCSDDETEFMLQEMTAVYGNLSYLNFRKNYNFFKGKKFPLSLGIRSATHDTIVLTDADCRPMSENWLRDMVSPYVSNSKTEIVLGYGGYEKQPTFLNKLIRFDTLSIAMQYMGLALCGAPYMGVGRNLSYSRPMFYRNKGFIYEYKIISGDDDLFVNKASRAKNTKVVTSKESITLSLPKTTLRSWIKQKTRHFSTAKYYKLGDKLLLSLYQLSTVAVYALLAVLLVNLFYYPIVLCVFGFRLLIQVIVFGLAGRKLNEKSLGFFAPVLELLLLFINSFVVLFTRHKKGSW